MWIKKHWNDPITVGGYTKLCVLSFAVSFIVTMAYLAYMVMKYTFCAERIKNFCSAIIHKIRNLKRHKNLEQTES